MKTKACKSCGEIKPFTQFWNHPQAPDGKQYNCVSCCKEQQRMYRHNQNQPNWRSEYLERWRRA